MDVLGGDWITQGPKVAEFEDSLACYCGSKYAVAVSSGTAALHLAALVAEFQTGREVVTSPITFAATSNSILYTGAKPVFADIDQATVCVDCREIERNLTPSTQGIIPVHFAGHPCDMPAIWELARARNLVVIEDACHALGAVYVHNGEKYRVGSCAHSDMACFSFHPVKHITTGEGGAVTTNDKKLYEKLVLLRNHGISKNPGLMTRNDGPWYYEMLDLGFNYRVTDFQCALGLSQLKRIDAFVERRKEIAAHYTRALASQKEIILPACAPAVDSSWHLYVIQLGSLDRSKVFSRLQNKKLGVQVHYIPTYLHPYYQRTLGTRKGDCPLAEAYYSRAITIPLFPGQSDHDVQYVIDSVLQVVRELS
jgi:UDP-4-amino-4,6-dideoxy-N-acetyl-beta-L-altrosamine transaminase